MLEERLDYFSVLSIENNIKNICDMKKLLEYVAKKREKLVFNNGSSINSCKYYTICLILCC